ncbi:MAG: CBS domain-containing protein [Nitrososphaerota archaeon]|nr:CBS domain-containing protein [Nitrososphaerales archaeon]MCX8191523.1 CBS domain-containing protein [Nitrososphaerales archaeon]MDW8044447.1 CBS domain-containing protein [Nitrososphaerota archaeon]
MSEPLIRTKILVREIMNSPVVSAHKDESVKSLAMKMAKSNVGSVIIMESDRHIGIVTDGDIVKKVVARGLDPDKVVAGEIMSEPLHTIDGNKDITEAARIMRKVGTKRLGVTYKDRLVGVISVSDLTAITPELCEIMSEKARIMMGESLRYRGYVVGYCDLCNQWSDYLQELDGKFLCEECRAEVQK